MVFKTKKSVFNVAHGFSELYERSPARTAAVPSVITAEMTVHGDLHSPSDVQVEGRVIGEVKVNRLVLAEGAAVTGDIIAKEVRICGTLRGTVRSEMVTLTETGRVIGDIYHDLLSIETGGQLEGRCYRLAAQPAEAAAPAAAQTPEAAEKEPEAEAGTAAPAPVGAMPRIYANGRGRNAAA